MAFPTGWAHRLPITIESDDISADLTDWSLVFDQAFDSVLTQVDGPLDADGSRASIDGGGDVRFSSDEAGTTQLACDVRVWDTNNTPASALCEVAVKVPAVSSSGDTTIYMWWGKTGETQPVVTDTYGQYNAYKSTIIGCWTLGEDPSAGIGAMKDRTSNQNHGTAEGMDATRSITSPLGKGVEYDGVNDEIDFGDYDLFSFGDGSNDSAFSFTCLFLIHTAAEGHDCLLGKLTNPNSAEYRLRALLGRSLQINTYDDSTNAYIGRNTANAIFTVENWYHAAFRYSGTKTSAGFDIFLNGSELDNSDDENGTYTAMENKTYDLQFAESGGGDDMDGKQSEGRLFSEDISDAWLIADYNNQLNTAGFLTWGSISDLGAATLVIADAAHDHTAELVDLTQAHTLVIAGAAHDHTAELVELTQAHTLAIDDAAHGHTAELVDLTQAHTLAIDDGAHGHTAELVDLTQAHTLVIADAAHGHTAELVDLTQAHTLVIADSAHGHTAELVDLAVTHILEIDNGAHGHTAELVDLTQAHTLVIADAAHDHTADNVELVAAGVLEVAAGLHGHTTENVTLTQAHTLAIADAAHGHTAELVDLTQAHTLVIADGAHGHTAEEPVFTQAHTLAIADAAHSHTAENVELVAAGVLEVAAALHGHTAENVTLTQAHTLAIADGAHDHTVENVELTVPAGVTLVIADADHGHTAELVDLTQAHTLVVADADHGHTAENVTLTQAHTLAIATGAHSHTAENVELSVGATLLSIDDGAHGHTAELLDLTQYHVLTIAGALHAHTAENILLSGAALFVQNIEADVAPAGLTADVAPAGLTADVDTYTV